MEIEIEKISVGYNPRKQFDLEKLRESIKNKGILVPLIIRPKAGKFEIICGESRYKCASELKLKTIPCWVKEYSEEDAAHLAFIDNEQRNNLSTVDKADHLNYMRNKFQLSASGLAEEYAIDKATVGRMWKISELGKDIKALCRHNDLGDTKLYEITKMLDKNTLINVYEDSSRKSKEEWDPATKKAYEKELFYREECQLQLIRRIISSYLTREQVKTAVTSYLNEFKKRNEQIKMETEEKISKFWDLVRKKLSDTTINIRIINSITPTFLILRESIPDEIFEKTGSELKERMANQFLELADELTDEKINELRKARQQLFNLSEELRR